MGGFTKMPPVHLFLLSDQQNMKPPIQNHKSPVVASFLEKQRLKLKKTFVLIHLQSLCFSS